MGDRAGGLDPYVTWVAYTWGRHAPDSRWRAIDGSLVFVDISGFTSLSERLAQRGRIGAEELTSVLDRVFGQMLNIVSSRGGSLLKFGGDALLLLFDSEDHVMQSCAAALEMRAALREASKLRTSVGRVNLRMSSGIHTGAIDFFLVGESHRELIVTGPSATATTAVEAAADAGEIVVSDAMRQALPSDFVGERKGGGWLLRKRRIDHPPTNPATRTGDHEDDLADFVPLALRAHLEAAVADSEHRIATVGFLKFQGVDKLLADGAAERVADKLHDLVTTVQREAEAEGITYLGSDIDADGGKIILSSGVPLSQHDNEGRMLRAARAILDSDHELSLRMGVSRGHVFAGNIGTHFRSTYTVMGDTVNLAARLMSAAGPGELYATPSVLNLSSTMYGTEALEPFQVKGKAQPVQAFSVSDEIGVRPPALSSDLPFRGRHGELEMLVGVVNTCSRSGRGGMMTITGETGIGKSRLIAEVLDQCEGIDKFMVQAEPSGVDNPYWAFRDPLRRFIGIERSTQKDMARQLAKAIRKAVPDLEWALPLLGDIAHIEIDDNETTAAIDARFRPDRTGDALIELLSAGYTRPVTLVVEDGQWLDEASSALLARIGDAARDRPWTVLVTARKDQAEVESWGSELALPPLSDDSMRAIAVETTRAAPLRPHELDQVVSKANGNPLFLGEILRVISETGTAERLPESLDAVISTEIDTLPQLPRRLLRYSSVLGRRFRRAVLEEFLAPEGLRLDDVSEEDLSRFIAEEETGHLTFRHSVVHDIAYESLPYAKRRQLHARAGDVIERMAGGDTEAAAEHLAMHYARSGAHEKAWQYSLVAGDRARSTFANAEAAAHYRRALEASRWIEVDDPDRARVMQRLGDALDRMGAFDDALVSYQRAQRTNPEPEYQASLLWVQGAMLKRMGELSRALRTLTRGLNLAAENGLDDVAVDLLAERASIRQYQGRHREALTLAEEALRRAGGRVRSEAVALSEIISDWARSTLGRADDHDATWRALRIAEDMGDLHIQGVALNNLGMYSYYAGEWDEAADLYERSSRVAQRTGDPVLSAYGQANVAEILSDQGHLDEAQTRFANLVPVFRSAGDQWMLAFVLTHQARILARRNQIDEALGLLDEAFEIYDTMGASVEVAEVLLRRAEMLATAGRPEQARQLLESRPGLEPSRSPARVRSLAYRVRGLVAWSLNGDGAGVTELRNALAVAEDLASELDQIAAIIALRSVGVSDPGQDERLSRLSQRLGVLIETDPTTDLVPSGTPPLRDLTPAGSGSPAR